MASRRWGKSSVFAAVMMTALALPRLRATPQIFDDRDATQLLKQISGGLVAHDPKKMLGAFDLSRMQSGASFEQDTLAFFGETGTIRVHFNLLRTAMEGAKGIANVNMEMEGDMADDRRPPLHKQAQLRLVCERSGSRWRIVDLTPHDFFSTAP